jgi:hypothetical protein
MVQVLKSNREKQPSFLQSIVGGLVQGLPAGIEKYAGLKKERGQQKAISDILGEEYAGLPPELQKIALAEQLKGDTEKGKRANELESNRKTLRGIEKYRELEEGSLEDFVNDPKSAELASRPVKPKETPLTAQEVPAEIAKKMRQIIKDNPNASSDELRLIADEQGIPPVYSNPYTENRRRTEEQLSKEGEAHRNALRQETLPIRTKLAEKAQAAEKGIQNKEQLLNLIEKGDINDPTFASLAEALPLNLGKRLLSNDTTEYKAGLVEEFSDLRNIFQGQTRVKEIDVLENKIADLYLTDDQKKAVLRSRINALKADIIRAEAAATLENRDDLGVLQFQKAVDDAARPRLEALFNQVLDEQKAIIQNAENRKEIPLDINDPEDKKIMSQILKEAGGDKTKAKQIAKKKGYTVKGAK